MKQLHYVNKVKGSQLMKGSFDRFHMGCYVE